MDYEKKYNEALERARKAYNAIPPESRGARKIIEDAFPELRESEDERIRQELLDFVRSFWADHKEKLPQASRWVDYLEKQKEPTPADGWDYADKRMSHPLYLEGFEAGRAVERELSEFEKQKEQKPISQEDFDKAKHEALWGEQKPTEKQDYSGLTDLERAIHRGFLCAGIENVPTTIIKETAKECLKLIDNYRPVEWSEDDEEMIERICANLEYLVKEAGSDSKIKEKLEERIKWMKRLKSLRPQPHWKPSEEQMKALNAMNCYGELSYQGQQQLLIDLYQQLKKL